MDDFSNPLLKQLGYLKFVLDKRDDNTDPSFITPIAEAELPAYEIGYHAIDALWTNALRYDPSRPEITTLETTDSTYGNHLLDLYERAILRFKDTVDKLDNKDFFGIISSPVSGNPVKLSDWLWTTVMHTIHHMGQCFRIQGIVQRSS